MDRRELADRLAEQFGADGTRSDAWSAFSTFLPTDEYLNLGYSGRFQSHLVGSPQARLVDFVADQLPDGPGVLLDVGCGRGGPTRRLAAATSFDVVGLDLVADNVRLATARTAPDGPSFFIADATSLPVCTDHLDAAVAVDAFVYLPDKRSAFAELARALGPDGEAVITDLLGEPTDGVTADDLAAFAEAWDMPPPWSRRRYRRELAAAGLAVQRRISLRAHSIGGFRRWTSLFLLVTAGPGRMPFARACTRYGIDPDRFRSQVRAAHAALPALDHQLFVVATR